MRRALERWPWAHLVSRNGLHVKRGQAHSDGGWEVVPGRARSGGRATAWRGRCAAGGMSRS